MMALCFTLPILKERKTLHSIPSIVVALDFYLGEQTIEVKDIIPLSKELPLSIKWLQDFLAPIVLLSQVNFSSKLHRMDNPFYPEYAEFINHVEVKSFQKKQPGTEYSIAISQSKIEIKSQNLNLCIE